LRKIAKRSTADLLKSSLRRHLLLQLIWDCCRFAEEESIDFNVTQPPRL